MSEKIEYIDFEFESIKDSVLDSKVVKKDKLNLIMSYLERSNNLEELLLSSNGKTTLIRKLSSKWNHLSKSDKIVETVYSNPRILLEALKGNMNAVLDGAPSNVFNIVLDGRPLVEHIFEAKIVKMNNVCSLLRFPNIFSYLKKYKFKDIDLIDLNNYLLDDKNDRLLLDELVDSGITNIYEIYNEDVVMGIINKKAFNLLDNVNYSFFKNKYEYNGSEKLLLDIVYDNNVFLSRDTINDIFLRAYFNEDFNSIIDTMYRYKKYEDLSYITYEYQILYVLPSGRTVLEELLLNGINKLSVKHFHDLNSISLILEYSVSSLYSKVELSKWLMNADLNNTFLDVLLDKKEDVDYSSLFSDLYELSPSLYAKIIMTFAKHNKLDQIEYNLLYRDEENDRSVLDYLMEYDSEFTLNNILSEKDKKNYNVELLSKIYEFKLKTFDLSVSVEEEMLEYQSNKYESGEISFEQQQLLDEFYNLMNDGNSSMELVNLCIDAYKKLFYENNPSAYDIIHLINYKREFPTFKIVENEYSSFSPVNTAVNLANKSIKTMMHELGHVIHWFVEKDATPPGFKDLISNNSFFSKADKHCHDLKELIKNTKQDSLDFIARMYSKNISYEYLSDINKFLSKEEYSKTMISKLLTGKRNYTLTKFIQNDISIKSNMMADFYIRNDDANMTLIYDILDALTRGESAWSYGLDYGHGSSYYRRNESLIFCEVFADYCSIIKSPDSSYAISILRKYVGDEFVDFMNAYYQKNILNTLNNDFDFKL